LESDQDRPHPRTEHSIDRAVILALLFQDDLHLPDLCRAQVERHCRSAASTLRPGRRLRTRRTDRHDRDDLVAAIDDDNVVPDSAATGLRQNMRTPKLLAQNRRSLCIDPVHLKNMLRLRPAADGMPRLSFGRLTAPDADLADVIGCSRARGSRMLCPMLQYQAAFMYSCHNSSA
jgi:hypothetical protein